MLLVAAALLAGCHTDPNVLKQRFLESGKRDSAQGDYRNAANQYRNALKIDKGYAEAHYRLAQAYEHLGQYNAAYGELTVTVALQPTNLNARIDLGNLLLSGGKTNDAEAQANAVMAAQPNNPDAHAILSAVDLRRGQKSEALSEIQRALELDPNRAAFHQNLALLQAGDPARSSTVEAELKKAVALDPKSANSKLLLAAFYVQGRRWPEAEQMSRDAVATDPKSIPAREDLAQVFLKQGNQAKAEEVLRQASNDLAGDPQGVRILADYYARSGQLQKARAEFASLYAKLPKNISVQKGYVRVLFEVNDYAAARAIVAGLMKTSGRDPEVAVLNGIVLLNDGKASDAVNVIREAAKDAPGEAFVQYWLGKAAIAKGDVPLAVTSFRQAAQLNPSRLESQEALSRIALERGDMDLLADVANKTVTSAPRFPGGYVWRAIVEMSRNSTNSAEADLKTAIGVAPQSPQAYLELGKLRFAQKRYAEGVPLLEQALQFDPASVEPMRLLVAYDLNQKHPDKAMARVSAQIGKSPNNSSLYDLMAELELKAKNLDQASATAKKALEMNSGDGEAVMLFAQIQIQLGQVTPAIAAWEQWSKAHPNDAGALAILGTLEQSRGDRVKAEAYYTKSLQIQPEQPVAANNLAYLLLEQGGNIDQALTLAAAARKGMPNSPNAADTLAWAYYQKGIYGFARDLLENAVKVNPNSATFQYHLGMVYSKLREKDKATIHLKKAISLAPDLPAGKQAQAALRGLG